MIVEEPGVRIPGVRLIHEDADPMVLNGPYVPAARGCLPVTSLKTVTAYFGARSAIAAGARPGGGVTVPVKSCTTVDQGVTKLRRAQDVASLSAGKGP